MQDLSLQKAQSIKPQNLISAKHRRSISHDVQIDGNRDADYRKCTQEHSRTHETTDRWDRVANGPQKNPQIDLTPAAEAGAVWKFVVHRSDRSWRMQHDTNASTSWTWTSSPRSRGKRLHVADGRSADRKFLFPSTVIRKHVLKFSERYQ